MNKRRIIVIGLISTCFLYGCATARQKAEDWPEWRCSTPPIIPMRKNERYTKDQKRIAQLSGIIPVDMTEQEVLDTIGYPTNTGNSLGQDVWYYKKVYNVQHTKEPIRDLYILFEDGKIVGWK